MSDKTYSLLLVGAGIFIIVVGFLLGWNVKPEKKCTNVIDSIYVKGDTVLVPYPVETIKWIEKKPGTQIDSTTYAQTFDSNFVSHNDTIGVKAEVEFNEVTKDFSMDMEIEHRDFEISRVDTIKINYTEIKEVQVPDPMMTTVAVTSTILLLLSLIALIFGG